MSFFIMLGLAVLHPVLTFTLEYLSLRGLTAKAFGTLMSLEPAIALLAGLLVLGQVPSAGLRHRRHLRGHRRDRRYPHRRPGSRPVGSVKAVTLDGIPTKVISL